MANSLKNLQDYPDISFIDDMTIDEFQNELIKNYTEKLEELTGEKQVLGKVDTSRLILYAAAVQGYQTLQYADRAGKMSLLKYSYGPYLDNLAALKGLKRNPATVAKTTIRFTLSEVRQAAVGIPKGTRVGVGSIYFATIKYTEIPPGVKNGDVVAECLSIGTVGNGYDAGDINTIVDSVRYVSSAKNITASEGGADEESDENFSERIHLAPSSYSTAGPDGAYTYWAKSFNPDVTDVIVSSPDPQVVDIRFIIGDGELPGKTVVQEMEEFLKRNDIRPLTDNVRVAAPDTVEYEIKTVYYVNESDRITAELIQTAVEESVASYIIWQKERIGRDINPSELIHRMVRAGAKRVVVTSPDFLAIPETSIALLINQEVTYGGLEDD